MNPVKKTAKKKSENVKTRPPIIVVMGHVDHGKTTLLDYIRKTNVAGKEAGGITQSVGAYEIQHPPVNGKKMTFIDTPGHEAFSKMRSRGATIADLGILVVAADEGIKTQTKEAISHLKTAELPFIVALNKIDKNNADPERVKQALAEAGVTLEGYGGDISYQEVSAKTGDGVNELLDLILLSAELKDLKYEPDANPSGIILETKTDSRKGAIAIAILKNGILKTGQNINTQSANGKIKALKNFQGKAVDRLEPSAPALIFGFETLPQTGEEFSAWENGNNTKPMTNRGEKNTMPKKALEPVNGQKTITETVDKIKSPKIILKADNAGSLEALKDLVAKIPGEIKFEIVNDGIGDIKENDLKFAAATKAIVAGFRVKIDRAAENMAKNYGVIIILSEIIYELLKTLERQLKTIEQMIGSELEVLAIFGKPKPAGAVKKQVVGGKIINGLIKNKSEFEVLRGKESLGFGKLKNLQQGKADIAEAEAGQEVGMMIESDAIIKEGDRLKFLSF